MLLATGPLDLGDEKLQDIVLESPLASAAASTSKSDSPCSK
jgi:hypothetical protein